MEGGNPLNKVGNGVLGHATGGAFSTQGNGWAQGGSASDVMGNMSFGLLDPNRNKINVPSAVAKPSWQLSKNGQLRNDLQLNGVMPGAFGQSQDSLNSLQKYANTTGPSEQAKYLEQANSRNVTNTLQNLDASNNSMVANATSNLAMRGGADSGARERMLRGSNLSTMQNRAKVMNDADGSSLKILADDEKSKLNVLQSLSPQLLAQAGFQQDAKKFDIGNTLQTLGNKYNQDMAAWAANQSAIEQANLANKPSGILGLGLGPL